MNPIDSYEAFCKALNGNPDERKRAKLLLFIQDWMVRTMDDIDEESMDYSLDKFLIENAKKQNLSEIRKDVLSRLVDKSFTAVRRISENMRQNILRENVKMPVYKVREVNSHGLNWLSRRPGTTVRDKVSSSNGSIMAVRRRMSLDTGENRLYLAYLSEATKLLQTKLDAFPDGQIRQVEEDFCSQASLLIRNTDFDEIRRWENMPPNHALLSDQNYKKIWKCWKELKQIDDLIREDHEKLSERLCTLFYVEFLTKASSIVRFPQVPVCIGYEDYRVDIFSRMFYGVDATGNVLKIMADQNTIKTGYLKKQMELVFEDDRLCIAVNGKKTEEAVLDTENILDYVTRAIEKSGLKSEESVQSREFPKTEKSNSVIMDIFSLRPGYVADGQPVAQMKGRLLYQQQEVLLDGERKKFILPCDQSEAVILGEGIETFSIASAVEEASSQKMTRLFHLLEQYITAHKFMFVFPDLYNEFQLSLVYKAARLVFQEVRSLPKSIGTAFSYMASDGFAQSFHKNEFLLVLDIACDDVSMTLIQGLYDEDVARDIPEYGGIIWERHPNVTVSIQKEIEELKEKLFGDGCAQTETIYRLFGLGGLQSEKGRLMTMFEKETFFEFSDQEGKKARNFRINITDQINTFLRSYKEIIKRNKVWIVSLCDSFVYKGGRNFRYAKAFEPVDGGRIYETLQQKSRVTLWRDHLPELAMKLLYGKFNLIKDETITPQFHVEKKIAISSEFMLSKNKKEYHFDLVQNDLNQRVRYAAVVKSPAFPLRQDVRCRLEMTYQYGSEEAYRLLFIPVQENAGFAEAKVTWEKIVEYPYQNLDAPDPVSSYSWKELRSFPCKWGQEDLTEKLTEKFELIQKGYFFLNLSKRKISMQGEPGKREFLLTERLEGKILYIKFKESHVDKQKNSRPADFNHLGKVSFELQKDEKNKRYFANLEAVSDWDVWMKTDRGYVCYPYLNIDGKRVKVAFFENEFNQPQNFDTNITNVSFEVRNYKSFLKAVKIHDEDSGEPCGEHYIAVNIRKGNEPAQYTCNGWMYFMMLSMFVGKNSFYDRNCPKVLRDAFENAKEEWFLMFSRCENEYMKMRIFNLLSIVANDLGKEYYAIAEKYVEDHLAQNGKITDYIGYALGDCTKEEQKSLLHSFYKVKDENVVRILSKAIWGNEDFIWNAPADKILEYFDAAVFYLRRLLQDEKINEKAVTMCFEYILGVFRLRKHQNRELDYRLSLNNPLMQELYGMTEMVIERNIEIKSFLKLEIKNKGVFENIPDLLYAVLVYITGESGAGDIRISGLELDDIVT